MGFLAIIAILLFCAIMAQAPDKGPGYTGKKAKTWCPPHRWIYGNDGFLICEECRNKPGYTPRE